MVRLLLLFALSALDVAADDCVNNDSTSDSYGDTCSSYYDSNPGDCGSADDADFTASEQCCACAANDAPTALPSTAAPSSSPTATPYPTCVNDDSTTDSDGGTCSTRYDSNPGDCGSADDDDFTASEQCCACAANDDNCVDDLTTTGLYNVDCTLFNPSYPSMCGYYDDADFTASLQCCECGGFLGKTLAPTISTVPTAVPSTAAPTTSLAPTCRSDDSTTDSYGRTCSSLYDNFPSICGIYDDEDFTASLQCCACGGYLGKTVAPTASPPPSTSAPSATPAPSPAPTATPAPSVYCLCDQTLVVAVTTASSADWPQDLTWSLKWGDHPDDCKEGSASGGPYDDAETLYTKEITICEGTTYTLEMYSPWGDYYLELDGSRFKEKEKNGPHFETFEFTSLVTTYFLRGSLSFDGITYETALANEAVFVTAVALMCDVPETAVTVTISQATRRRRLSDDGVAVAYDVAVEDGDPMRITDRIEGFTDSQVGKIFLSAAEDADVAGEFETLVITEREEPTIIDPYGPYSYSFRYTVAPTLSLVPSISPAPSTSCTEAPSITPAPTATFAPTRAPFRYEPTVSGTSYCRLHDASVCWGNSRRFLKVAENRPFDSIVGLETSNAAFGDVDGDGDLDLLVGDWSGEVYFFRNVGSARTPEFVGPITACANPFNGISVYKGAIPALADLDGDDDLDMVLGQLNGELFYYENVGSAERPEFVPSTGDASPFPQDTVRAAMKLDLAPALADLDGDGDLDVICGEYERISYYENIGSATKPQFVLRAGGADPFDGINFGRSDGFNPALADLDGDSDLDLLVGEATGSLKYYENVGSARLAQFVASANPFEGITVAEYSAPRFIDLDGDSDLDLVVGADDGAITFYENKWIGVVAPEFVRRTGDSTFGFVEIDTSYDKESEGIGLSTPTLIDYDGDNDLDVVVGHVYYNFGGDDTSADEALLATDALYFYENVGGAEAPEFSKKKTGSENPFSSVDAWGYSAAAFGDLDADGDFDLVLGNNDGSLFYYENVGSSAATFVARLARANPMFKFYQEIDALFEQENWAADLEIVPAYGDLDGDGDIDLVVGAENTAALLYFENNGTTTFPNFKFREGVFTDVVFQSGAPVLVDLDDDGDLDLVIDNCYCVDDSTTTGLYDLDCTYYDGNTGDCGDYDDADFTASEQCCACGRASGGLAYFENTGTANVSQFVARTGTSNPFDGLEVGTHCRPAFADVDNDDDVDLILGGSNGALQYYQNNGTAAIPEFIAVGANPFASVNVHNRSAPALIDYDKDGDLDLAVGTADGTIVYYANTGTPKLPEYNAAVSPFAFVDVYANGAPAFSDLDGDNDPDLLVGGVRRYYYNGMRLQMGNFFYYENTGSAASHFVARTGGANLLPFQLRPMSRPTLGDIDSDGDLDLIVGDFDGALLYFKNVGNATTPVFVDMSIATDAWDPITYEHTTCEDLASKGYCQSDPDAMLGCYGACHGGNPLNGFALESAGSAAPTLVDYDGDLDLDLVVGADDGRLYYLANNGSATTPLFVPREVAIEPLLDATGGEDGYSAPVFGDVDGDGDLDLVVGQADGKLSFFANSFCVTSCNARGVCDDSATFLPTCICRLPFIQAQCDECPSGYFGSTCQLCPEGGDESILSPRIKDTCGVARSGRSRGTCDDGYIGSGNCTCFEEHFTGAGCSGGGCPNGTIENVKENGVFSEAGCDPCPEGSYQTLNGDNQAICTRCPSPSTSMMAGATGCNTCNEGFYFSPFPIYEGRDGMEPVRCDNAAALKAQCQDEDDPACFDQCCLKCEKGMNCEKPANNTLQALAIEDGYWRDTVYSHQVYPCEYTDSCKAGACTIGHRGVACRVCEAGYHYSSMDGRCIECPGSGKRPNLALVIGVLIFLVVMLGIFLYCYVRRPEMLFVFQVDWRTLFREGFSGLMGRATEEAKARAEAKIKGKLNDAALGAIEGNEDAAFDAVAEEGEAVDAIAEEGEEEEAAQGAAGKDGAALDDVPDGTEGAPGADTKKKKKTDFFATIGKFQGDFVAKLKTKLKIVLSVYQIQNSLPWLLPAVSYPGTFEGLTGWMTFIELDFVRIVPMSCMFPYNFFNKLFGSTMFPLVLAAAILLFGKISSWLRTDKEKKRAAWTGAYSWFLLLTFMVFTSASTTVLRFFNCVDYESVDATGRSTKLRVLQADHGISCDSPSYEKWSVYAWIMVFIYPVGIPLLYFAELWYHRKAINPEVAAGYAVINPDVSAGAPPTASAGAPPAADAPADGDAPPAGLTIMSEKDVQELKIKRRSEDKSIQHLEFLFRDYEPRTYLFIVFECVRRLALTGMLIFIFPGSASQIVVGLFVAVFSQLIIAAAGPYHEDQDDTLATVGQFQIVLVFISSFVLLVKDIPQQQGDAGDLWKGPAFAGFMLFIGTMTLLMTLYTLICDSALAQSVYTRYSRWRHRNRVKPAEAPAPAPAPSPAPAPAPCVAEAPVPAASTVEAEAPAAPSLGVYLSGRPRTVVRRGEPRDVVADPADDPPPSLALSERPRTAPAAPSLGLSTSGRPRTVVRRGEPRDPIARPLHAGPPSRRPPPLQPGRRPTSR